MRNADNHASPKTPSAAGNKGNSGPLAAFLRFVLLATYGLYALVFGVGFLALLAYQDFSAKYFSILATVPVMAWSSFLACRCAWRRQARVSLYALVVFLFGFVMTTVYRLAYVVDALDSVDVKNFLMFAIPMGVAFVYRAQLAGRT